MYDIFFISYNESNASSNLDQLKKRTTNVQHLHGIEGIANAYKKAADLSSTDHFFIVDGDNFVLDEFDFYKIENINEHPGSVHVWRSLNAVNNLVYGYGGVKLFPKTLFENMPPSYLDFSMTLARAGYFIQKDLASITKFNATPLEAWRGAFRECVKLSLELDNKPSQATQERLRVWTYNGIESDNGVWAMIGARMGRKFHSENKENPEDLKQINNFKWLEKEFLNFKDSDPNELLVQLKDWVL